MAAEYKKILLEGDAAELTSADPEPVDGTALAVGTATTAARADHIHALGPLVANLDFSGTQAVDMLFEKLASAPTAVEGKVFFNTVENRAYLGVDE